MSRSRNYCFTVNNPVDQDQDPHGLLDIAEYLVFQLEEGENGTPHFQGFVRLKDAKTMTALQAYLRAAYSVARGTPFQNKEYCTKEEGRLDGPYEFGDVPKQGKRSDLLAVKAMLDDKATDEEIADEHFGSWCRYHKSFSLYRTLKTVRRTTKTIVNYYYGVTFSGKSFRASQEAGPDAFYKEPGNKWFDGYCGEKHVIFDDFRGNWFPFSTLLRILDAYPCRVELKGGTSVEFIAEVVWITSNVAPDQLYQVNGVEMGALLRRIENVVYFNTPFCGANQFAAVQDTAEAQEQFPVQNPLDVQVPVDEVWLPPSPPLEDETVFLTRPMRVGFYPPPPPDPN